MTSWPRYLQRFHADRAGITEDLLGRCMDEVGLNPYQWLLATVPAAGLVLDVGCGSGPVAEALEGWMGIDISEAELVLARRRGRRRVVAGRAEHLPVAAGSVPTALGVMSLMVVDDPGRVLQEMARVLRPGGRLALLVPDTAPLTTRDRVRFAMLLALLGRRAMPFPQPDLARRLSALLAEAGFAVTADERKRFECPVSSRADADRVVDSLYLPDVAAARTAAAKVAVRAWGDAPLGMPLRRVAAVLGSGS